MASQDLALRLGWCDQSLTTPGDPSARLASMNVLAHAVNAQRAPEPV